MAIKLKKYIKKILFMLSYYKDFRGYHHFHVPKRVLKNSDYALMESGCKCLEEIDGLIYRITDGTILGLYRDGEFIKHDDDVDIDILYYNINQVKLIKGKLKKLGYIIGREAYYKGKIQQIAFYLENGFIFDIIFWHKIENEIYNYSEEGYERIQNYKYFDIEKLDYINFHNKSYPIPTPTEEWLEFRYGDDWKIPKTYKGDWKEECFDMSRL